eukprot:2764171-Amphidinium_carterae.3
MPSSDRQSDEGYTSSGDSSSSYSSSSMEQEQATAETPAAPEQAQVAQQSAKPSRTVPGDVRRASLLRPGPKYRKGSSPRSHRQRRRHRQTLPGREVKEGNPACQPTTPRQKHYKDTRTCPLKPIQDGLRTESGAAL